MAAVAALGKPVQQSMPTSEDDAEYEDYDQDAEMTSADSAAANKQLLNGIVQAQQDGSNGTDIEMAQDDVEMTDQDAEGEDDDEYFGQAAKKVQAADEDDSDYEDDDISGAVKHKPVSDNEDDDAYTEENGNTDEEASEYSSAESAAASEDEVEVESDNEDAPESAGDATRTASPNSCVLCQREEDDDPSDTSGGIVCCAVCGDHAHKACVKKNKKTSTNGALDDWRCDNCISNSLEPEHADLSLDSPILHKRLSSAPRLARDLLPAHRGAIKPDSHSVFAQLILNDDPIDGSRHLRKRKSPSPEPEDKISSPAQKRRKRSSAGRSNSIADTENTKPGIPEFDEMPSRRSATPRASRSLRATRSVEPSHAVIEKRLRKSILVKFKVPSTKLKSIMGKTPKPQKKKRGRGPARAAPAQIIEASSALYRPQSFSQPFYSLIDKEDELNSKPYGGILTEAEADTSNTMPLNAERDLFDESKQKAQAEWKEKTAADQAAVELLKKPRKISGPASQIECINFGGFEIDTWYAAPYPEEYSCNRVLYICEFCLKYMNSDYVAYRHKMKCPAKCPPGDEIYRDGSISMFEVDGRKHPVYCQNLCLLAKLFLGSKTLYYDVEPFLFYVMTESDEHGCHLVGYFSKEKRSASQNNVSCILTLPIHQRKGYGNLLIDFSYLLTRVEEKTGSPEKPLSDMGLVSYRNYWRLVLCYQLSPTRGSREPLSITDLSEKTGMTADDIVSALEGLRALVRDPITKTYAMRLDYDFMEEYIKKWENKKYVRLNPDALTWTPYVMGRNNQHLLENAPPLTAISHPEGDEAMEPPHANGVHPHGLPNGDNPDGDVEMADAKDPAEEGDSKDVTMTNGISEEPAQAVPEVPAIPPSRYEIFPPVNPVRPKPPRASMSAANRLQTPRTAPARSRTAAANAARRAAATARKASSRARKASGGTGRGPGRYPKGTKKSDFGNASSGPGMPPGYLEGEEEDDIMYETPAPKSRTVRPKKKKVIEDDDEDLVVGDI